MKLLKNNNLLNLTLEGRKSITGYLFISPFIIGFIIFFLSPFLQSILFSISELNITTSGFNLENVGFENFSYALFTDANFNRVFVETVVQTLVNIPIVIIFSFFMANLLNQDFRGRTIARAVFFLPVISRTPVLLRLEQHDWSQMAARGLQIDALTLFSGADIEAFLYQLKLPEGFLDYIITAISHVPDIISASAIPILIFLAGLQSIPSYLYEAADIEGATGWERFWKITYPLLTPLFLTNIVYIIIDSFTAADNRLVALVQDAAWSRGLYGVSVAMTWIYFAFIALVLILVIGILNKYVVYIE